MKQFKKGKKRAKALEEAETMYAASGNSALCIALAKMHTTLAVEQVCGCTLSTVEPLCLTALMCVITARRC
jgi:hypothetical protein